MDVVPFLSVCKVVSDCIPRSSHNSVITWEEEDQDEKESGRLSDNGRRGGNSSDGGVSSDGGDVDGGSDCDIDKERSWYRQRKEETQSRL